MKCRLTLKNFAWNQHWLMFVPYGVLKEVGGAPAASQRMTMRTDSGVSLPCAPALRPHAASPFHPGHVRHSAAMALDSQGDSPAVWGCSRHDPG